MQFLEPYMKYRVTENIEMGPNKSSTTINSDQDVSTSGTTDNVNRYSPSHKRAKLDATTSQNNQDNSNIQQDALDAFFNCVRQSTREMPQWMQTNVKKKIFAVIIEAEERLAAEREDKSNYDEVEDSIQDEVQIKDEVATDEDEEFD